MTEQIEDWSPWVDHDGGVCPLPVGTFTEITNILGCIARGHVDEVARRPPPHGKFNFWFWPSIPDFIPQEMRIIKYRWRRSQQLKDLMRLAENTDSAPRELEDA